MDVNRPGLQLPPDLQVSSLLLSKETHEKEAEGGKNGKRNRPDGKKKQMKQFCPGLMDGSEASVVILPM